MHVQCGYDEDHEAFRDSIARFFSERLTPSVEAWRDWGRIPADFMAAAAEQGVFSIGLPEVLGGAGVSDPRFPAVAVQEAMRCGAAGFALLLAQQVGVCIPQMLRHAGEGFDGVLEAVGDGRALIAPVVVDGSLRADFVPGAAVADFFLVCERDGALAPIVRLVPRAACSISEATRALGGAEAAIADIEFDRADLESRMAQPGGELLRDLDLWAAVLSAAGAEYALALTLSYVSERHVFGKPVASFENTQFRLAEVAASSRAARAYLESCLSALGEGSLTAEAAACARLVCGNAHDAMVDQGIQFHGGYGYIREYPISTAFSDARFLRLASGAACDPRQQLSRALGI